MLGTLGRLLRRAYYKHWKTERWRIGKDSCITGRLHVRHAAGQIHIGDHCVVEGNLVIQAAAGRIELANHVYIGGETLLACSSRITIEDDALISYQCVFMDTDSHSLSYQQRRGDLTHFRQSMTGRISAKCAPIRVGRGAWVGARSIILKGVSIGMGAIVGAGSVVTKDVAPWTIVAGNPARLIRHLTAEEIGVPSSVPAA
jgi:acetyltransferase-like isoleucine patch superfamily enzyme